MTIDWFIRQPKLATVSLNLMGWLCTSNTARSSLVFGPPPPLNRQHHAPPHLFTPHGQLLRLLLLYANIWHIRVLSQESSQLRKPFPSYWKLAFIGLLASFLITFPDSAFLLETSAWKEIFTNKFYHSPNKCKCENVKTVTLLLLKKISSGALAPPFLFETRAAEAIWQQEIFDEAIFQHL